MNLPTLSAAALGLATLGLADGSAGRPMADATASDGGVAALVGQDLYASEAPLARWGEPSRAEDVATERLGRVAEVVAGPDGAPLRLVVAVGGLWGLGAQDVTLGMERVHLLAGNDGALRLVVDLSAGGAAPLEG